MSTRARKMAWGLLALRALILSTSWTYVVLSGFVECLRFYPLQWNEYTNSLR
jgi:hypothetical protein